jgi:transposase-like protein
MAVIPDFRATTISSFITQNVAPGSTIHTDGLKSFAGLQELGFKHIPRTQPLRTELSKGTPSVVPLADRAIGNLQQWLIGTHHRVSRAQLQAYLDEFVFRHNRRKQPMAAFQTLLGLGTARTPTSYASIRNALDLSNLPLQAQPPTYGGVLKQPDKQKPTRVKPEDRGILTFTRKSSPVSSIFFCGGDVSVLLKGRIFAAKRT